MLQAYYLRMYAMERSNFDAIIIDEAQDLKQGSLKPCCFVLLILTMEIFTYSRTITKKYIGMKVNLGIV